MAWEPAASSGRVSTRWSMLGAYRNLQRSSQIPARRGLGPTWHLVSQCSTRDGPKASAGSGGPQPGVQGLQCWPASCHPPVVGAGFPSSLLRRFPVLVPFGPGQRLFWELPPPPLKLFLFLSWHWVQGLGGCVCVVSRQRPQPGDVADLPPPAPTPHPAHGTEIAGLDGDRAGCQGAF